jgi:hypothetical protein
MWKKFLEWIKPITADNAFAKALRAVVTFSAVAAVAFLQMHKESDSPHSVWLTVVGAIAAIMAAETSKWVFEVFSGRIMVWATERLTATHGELARRTKTRLSVTALFARQRSQGLTISVALVFCVFFLEWLEYGVAAAVSSWAFIAALCFLCCVLFDNVLLYYRIAKGYFGNTEIEAREIVAYILENSDSFGSDGGGFRIFDPAESETQVAEGLYGPQTIGAGR